MEGRGEGPGEEEGGYESGQGGRGWCSLRSATSRESHVRVRVRARRAAQRALLVALTFELLCASSAIALSACSLVVADLLVSSASSLGTPPASTMPVRLSGSSRERVASTAAA